MPIPRFIKTLLRPFRPYTWFLHWLDKVLKRTVLSGPFRGMRYVNDSIGSAYYPKLLGTYELELHEIIERQCNNGAAAVVDVGAAEGYYAIGMARRNSRLRVYAFESLRRGRDLVGQMAQLNGVDSRVRVLGHCDAESLAQTLEGAGNAFVIMDVEGAEDSLLDPASCDGLRRSPILVELHEAVVPGVERLIRERFCKTHEIQRIVSRSRRVGDLPLCLGRFRRVVLRPWLLRCMCEWRGEEMAWLYMRPLSLPHGGSGAV